MYNLFKSIYYYIYYRFVQLFYKKVVSKNDEDIYNNKNNYVIVVKDVEVGRRLYEIVKALSDEKVRIRVYWFYPACFEFTKYEVTQQNSIQWFCIKGEVSFNWSSLCDIDKLQEIQSILRAMQSKGFILDDEKFKISECSSISEWLSCFIRSNDEDKIERSIGCMIKYIHYVLSGGSDFQEFYENIDSSNKVIYKVSEFPYKLPVLAMCYNYFKTGCIPYRYHETLNYAKNDKYDENYLIAFCDKIDSNFKVTEQTDEYTIYNGNIKIYQEWLSQDYQEFLRDRKNIDQNRRDTIEQIETIIIDINNRIIGYKFVKQDQQDIQSVLNPTLDSQNELFTYIMDMVDYLGSFDKKQSEREVNDFEIEKGLIFRRTSGLYGHNFSFKILTVKDLFNLTVNNRDMLEEQVTVIFFKVFANYMKQKYGELSSSEQFMSKPEVRFLSPCIVREFINFTLGSRVDYQVATKELFKFFNNKKVSSNTSFCYDSRFFYDPFKEVSFVFDYEAEKRYEVKLKESMTLSLPDGRRLITFDRSQSISKFADETQKLLKSIINKVGDLEDEHVKFMGFSEIIISTSKLNKDNMYNIVGYVTEPFRGEQLANEQFLKLKNKDLLKLAGYLFTKFSRYYIPWNHIWMDKNFVFYVNYLDVNFCVTKSPSKIKNCSDFVRWVFDYLLSTGYNSNAFEVLDIPADEHHVKEYLLNLANSLDAYCDEHDIFYNSKYGQCPVCAHTKYLIPQDFEETLTKVFEDSMAIHYSIDEDYNLKVYKPILEDFGEIEENVSKIVNLRCKSHKIDLLQDCFIPCKKAIDGNKKFVGYVYEATKFGRIKGKSTDVCVDLEDTEGLMNLARLKSLIRFILQVEEITKQNLGFMRNPFTHVFLNTTHKKQVQILNIEFLCGEGNVNDTEQWACEYVYRVLQTDTTIEINLNDCPKKLHLILSKLTDLVNQMTKYCPIHKMYYKSSFVCCPKCADPENQKENIYYENRTDYKQNGAIDEGGESLIYSYENDTVAKIFKEGEVNIALKNIVIFGILGRKDVLDRLNKENHKYKYVSPKKILVDRETNEIFGYVMDRVDGAFPISILRDKEEVKKLGFTMKDIFEILITMGEGIETLHKEANIYIGDLNGRNILFDSEKNVYFIDFDGMGIDEIAPEFCTDGYIDPQSKNSQNITMKDDWYSFAVQAFYYLTYTHPFNGIYYVEKDGRKVMLEIPDKMERRISLLGNHGMKAPTIALPWDWMKNELKSTFLNIFEGDYRESIVPQLKNQYQILYKDTNHKSFDEIYRINPKFIATKLKVFDGNVVKVIRPYAAICEKGNNKYVELFVKCNNQIIWKTIFTQDCQKIDDILISEDGKIAFIVYYEDKVIVVDLEKGKLIYHEKISDATNVIVNDRTMYFTGISRDNFVIFKRTIQPDGEILKENIRIGNQRIKWFDAKFNTKFVLIEQATQEMDEVYCNSEKFCTMHYTHEEDANHSKYNIIYDMATKAWLVVNNYGRAIIIQKRGEKVEFDISKYVTDDNLANIDFYNGNIYIPSQDCLYIANVKNKVVKKMECHKIMTPESKLYDINSSGFSVITNNVLYEVRKG